MTRRLVGANSITAMSYSNSCFSLFSRCSVFQQKAGGRSNFILWISVCVHVCVFQLVSLSRHLSVRAIVCKLWNEFQTDRSGMNELGSGGDRREKARERERKSGCCLRIRGWCACKTVTSKSALKQGLPYTQRHRHNGLWVVLST